MSGTPPTKIPSDVSLVSHLLKSQGDKDRCLTGHGLPTLRQPQTLPWRAGKMEEDEGDGSGQVVHLGGTEWQDGSSQVENTE